MCDGKWILTRCQGCCWREEEGDSFLWHMERRRRVWMSLDEGHFFVRAPKKFYAGGTKCVPLCAEFTSVYSVVCLYLQVVTSEILPAQERKNGVTELGRCPTMIRDGGYVDSKTCHSDTLIPRGTTSLQFLVIFLFGNFKGSVHQNHKKYIGHACI